MKTKTLILLSAFLLYPFSVFAQWGVKGGVDFSTIFYSPSVSLKKYETGFNIGAIYDIKLSKKRRNTYVCHRSAFDYVISPTHRE